MTNDYAEERKEYAEARIIVIRRNWRSAMLQTAESLETQAKIYRAMAEEGKADKPSQQLFSMTVTAERDGRSLRRALAANILGMIEDMRSTEEELGE